MEIIQLNKNQLLIEFMNEYDVISKEDFVNWCLELNLEQYYYEINSQLIYNKEKWLEDDRALLCLIIIDNDEQMLQMMMKFMGSIEWSIIPWDATLYFDIEINRWGLQKLTPPGSGGSEVAGHISWKT